jgi:endoglucanase
MLDGDRPATGVAPISAALGLVATAGFDTVRLPVKWPDALDPAFFARVELAVEAALARGLEVVLDVHHFDALSAREDRADEARFLALWEQIAARFARVGRRLWFELLNEPHDRMDAARWNRLLPEALGVVRATSPDRDVIAGPVRWNIVDALETLEPPEDPQVAVTVHYYSPFRFTHQGARWLDGAERWRGTTWGSAADRARVRDDLERAAAWAAARDVPLVLGEFGTIDAAPMAERAAWAACVRADAERLGIAWCYWDFATEFGAYDVARGAWHEPLRAALLG